ncbi:MAG: hypothetical protein U1E65_11240 [Myxococcota bacterium]
MGAREFLAEIEPLTHRQRLRRLVDLARAAKADPGNQAVLTGLAQSEDPYARSLAIEACAVTRDAALIETALRDPSGTVRRKALGLAPLVLDDARAEAALTRIDAPRMRLCLVQGLRRRGRTAPIARWLRSTALKDPRAADLVALGGEAIVNELWPSLRDRLSPPGWARLAKHTPAIAALAAMEMLKAPALDPRARWRLGAIAPLLAQRDPDIGLALLERLLEQGEEPRGYLVRGLVQRVLVHRPQQVFDALKKRTLEGKPAAPPGAMAIARFDRVAHRLGFERLAYLIEHAWSSLSDDRSGKRWLLRLDADTRARLVDHWLDHGRSNWGAFLLRYVPAEVGPRRERAFRRWSSAAQDKDGLISLAALAALPPDLRAIEARRHLERVEVLKTKHPQRIAYARFLPAAEASAVLAPYLGHPEGEERARALETLIAAVPLERARLMGALETVRARKFEQDPVRMAMMNALAEIPVVCFRPEHLALVGQIVRDGLDAADLSPGTAAAIERWVVRLFRVDPSWGARWLTTLLQTRGGISARGLGDGLLPGDMPRLAAELAHLAQTWATQERASAVIWLAGSLGIRLKEVPALLDALERLAAELPFAGVAAMALGLLKVHAGARFGALVPRLLASDPSFAILPDVALFLARQRQDLLGPYLRGTPLQGRFATGRTLWVLDFASGTARWTSAQQRAYAQALLGLLADEKREVPTLRFAIDRLVTLALAPSAPVIALAADPRPPVREMAVRGLAHLDGPEALAALLECLGDDRVRWAIYALRGVFAELPKREVIERLRAAPMNKVTVAKEVVRLLGELGGDEVYPDLIALAAQPLHRDVRIALLRSLWDHLEHPETWQLFGRAASDPDWVVASRLADVPVGRLTPAQEEQLIALLAKILERPEPDARTALLARAAYLPLSDARRHWFRALVARLESAASDDEARSAAGAAMVRMRPEEVGALVAAMRAVRPRRQRFLALLASFQPGPYAPNHQHALASGVFELLRDDPVLVADRIQYCGAIHDYKVLVTLLQEISAAGQLHYDALAAAEGAIQRSIHPELIEARLAPSKDPNLRRLAVAGLASAARPKEGWTIERRHRLERYRKDEALVVSAAAHHLFPPEV